MKKLNLTRASFITAVTCLPLANMAQHYSTSDETTVGLMVEANFSGVDYHGITPAFTIGCSTYQLHFGPRISFRQMVGETNSNELHFFFDIGYRYSFFQQNGWSVFAALRCEYDSYRNSKDWYHSYPATSPLQNEVYLADYAFDARTAEHHRYFNPYLGAGVEFILVDKLYVTTFGGAGFKTISGYSQHYNIDTGEMMLENNYFLDMHGFSWLASAGIGYRL